MKSYQYPQVPHPTSRLTPQTPQSSHDGRFSWMSTTAEVESRMWQQNTQHRSNIPPLPQIPDQYNSKPQLQDERHAQHVSGSTQDPTSKKDKKSYPVRTGTHATYTSHSVTAPQNQPYSNPERQLDPVKIPTDELKQKPVPIEPDANPLTPTSPVRSEHDLKTNNLAVLPPHSITTSFPMNTYPPMVQESQGGNWEYGLCSCGEPSICLTALMCPCIVYGKTQYRLGLRSEKRNPTNLLGYTAINGSCMAFTIFCGISSILSTIQHTRIRKTYQMQKESGNVFSDCLTGLCCCCCLVAQAEKEVKFREESCRKSGATGSLMTESYTSPTAMMFSAPPK